MHRLPAEDRNPTNARRKVTSAIGATNVSMLIVGECEEKPRKNEDFVLDRPEENAKARREYGSFLLSSKIRG
jgi:hypothetical protein